MQRHCLPFMLTGILVVATPATTGAAPLDEEACTQLKQEVQLLESRGARTNMANGPTWAKANLAKDKLAEIKSLIEIEEALAFRCPPPKSKAKAEKTAAGAAATAKPATTKTRATQSKKGAKTNGQPRNQQPKGKPRPVDKATARPVEKSKAKPKSDDSYRPPAPRRDAAPPKKPQTDASAPGKATAPRPARPAQSVASPPPPAFKNPFTSAY